MSDAESRTPLTDERRAELRERLERWLDALQTEEELPPYLDQDLPDAQETPDLVSLYGAMKALAEEFRIQTRGYRKLHEGLGRLEAAVLAADRPSLRAGSAAVDPALTAAERANVREEARFEVIRPLLDIHDRLHAGLAVARARLVRQSPLTRLLKLGKVQKSVLEGLALTMERFDAFLAGFDIRRFGARGDAFDAASMRAVDVLEGSSARPGTVTQVLRGGYRSGSAIVRHADVQVAK